MGPSSPPDPLSEDLASLRIPRTATVVSAPGSAWRYPALILALVAAAATAWFAWPEPNDLPKVQSALVRAESAPSAPVSLSAAGYLVAERVTRLGSRVMGRIQRVHVREAEHVRTGQVLFSLDATDAQSALGSAVAQSGVAQARLLAAQAQLAEVQLQHERARILVANSAMARAPAQDLEARLRTQTEFVRVAAAEVRAHEQVARAARTTLDSFTIRAPMDGVVSTRPLSVGDVVTQESVLLEIVDEDSLLVEVDVPEAHLERLSPGTPCEVVFDAFPRQKMSGGVVDIGPRINRAKATATVKVRLQHPEPGLRPDMAARVSFLAAAPPDASGRAGSPPARWVPAAALTQREERQVLFVLAAGDVVQVVPVEVGRMSGAEVELKTGPEAGTRVVVHPPAGLVHAQRVQEERP